LSASALQRNFVPERVDEFKVVAHTAPHEWLTPEKGCARECAAFLTRNRLRRPRFARNLPT
jgi:hypothetical protein